MHYALIPGISFCRASQRIIFLDIQRDRYFCLSRGAEHCFGQLIDGETLSRDEHSVLARLAADGILKPTSNDKVPKACPAAPRIRESLLDMDPNASSFPDLLSAASALAGAPVLLRFLGLGRFLQDTARRKARVRDATLSSERLCEVAAAFDRLRFVATAHDRCLVRSIAIARRLIALGGRPELVIGVKLQPFKAHCWVQHGSWLVNDRDDAVRNFTPILIV